MERADIVSEGFFAGLRLELYDLASDPMETTNMAGGQEVTFYWMNMKMSKMQESEVVRMLALLEEEVTTALALPKVQNHNSFLPKCR